MACLLTTSIAHRARVPMHGVGSRFCVGQGCRRTRATSALPGPHAPAWWSVLRSGLGGNRREHAARLRGYRAPVCQWPHTSGLSPLSWVHDRQTPSSPSTQEEIGTDLTRRVVRPRVGSAVWTCREGAVSCPRPRPGRTCWHGQWLRDRSRNRLPSANFVGTARAVACRNASGSRNCCRLPTSWSDHKANG
jgi:hypothetical protein